MHITLDGNIYDFDRSTGNTVPAKIITSMPNATNSDENWSFLDKEYIFKDVLLHQTHTFQEEMLREIEKATTSQADLLINDQSILTHHDFQGELLNSWDHLWEIWHYLKIAWFIWVTIACGFQTYGTVQAVLDYYKGRARNSHSEAAIQYITTGSPKVQIRKPRWKRRSEEAMEMTPLSSRTPTQRQRRSSLMESLMTS